MGEPAGIGLELVARVRAEEQTAPFVLFAPPELVRQRIARFGIKVAVVEVTDLAKVSDAFANGLPVFPIKSNKGDKGNKGNKSDKSDNGEVAENCLGTTASGSESLQMVSLTMALEATLRNDTSGVVTLPIAKSTLPKGFLGQTEFCGSFTKGKAAMMLINDGLKVTTATTHIPLRDVATSLTQDLIYQQAMLTLNSLRQDFAIEKPRLAVATLNPHGEENGLVGKEEQAFIIPAIEKLGASAFGPVSADTMFSGFKAKQFDAALCMYHDQALIGAKCGEGFSSAVNVTIGLKVVRCSPAHGIALDIARKGIADNRSLTNAIATTAQIVENRTLSSS